MPEELPQFERVEEERAAPDAGRFRGPIEYHVALLVGQAEKQDVESEILSFTKRVGALCTQGKVVSDQINQEIAGWTMAAPPAMPYDKTRLTPLPSFQDWANRQVSRAKLLESYNLTDREFQVGVLIAQGMGIKEISAKLTIAVGTVKSHKKKLFAKMGATNNVQVALKFLA